MGDGVLLLSVLPVLSRDGIVPPAPQILSAVGISGTGKRHTRGAPSATG